MYIAVFSGCASELKSGTAQSSCGCADLACVPCWRAFTVRKHILKTPMLPPKNAISFHNQLVNIM
jgi:hypothetical protein